MTTWNEIWNGAKELPFWAFSIRAVLLYTTLIIATRFMRQRQIAIHTGHNYLVAAGIVSLAAVRMVNPESSLAAGLVIVTLYAAVNVLQSYLDVFPRLIDRHATILVENGQFIKKNMLDARITIDNLMGQLRVKNIFSLSEVELAIIEPTGKINVIKKASGLPVTRKQMKLPLKNSNLPTVLIYDGKIQNENLKMVGHDVNWLDGKIKEKGLMQVKDIFLALLESDGTVYVSVKGGDALEGIWSSVEKLSTLGFAARTLIVGFMLYIASRFLPQRSGGQYAGFDFTFFWMMGGLIASPLFDSRINFTNTITAAVTIYLMHYLISFIAVKSRTFERVVYGKAEILVSGGKIRKRSMPKDLLPIELLLAQLREADAPNVNEVEMAIHETNGRVSILKKSDHQPVTPADLNISTVESGLPVILVNDGKVLDKNLKSMGYDRKWLKEQILKFGTTDFKKVYLATIDGTGEIYCSLSE